MKGNPEQLTSWNNRPSFIKLNQPKFQVYWKKKYFKAGLDFRSIINLILHENLTKKISLLLSIVTQNYTFHSPSKYFLFWGRLENHCNAQCLKITKTCLMFKLNFLSYLQTLCIKSLFCTKPSAATLWEVYKTCKSLFLSELISWAQVSNCKVNSVLRVVKHNLTVLSRGRVAAQEIHTLYILAKENGYSSSTQLSAVKRSLSIVFNL